MIRFLIIFVIFFIISTQSFLSAFGNIHKSKNPEIALLSYPKNGFAYASLVKPAIAKSFMENEGRVDLMLPENIVRSAELGFLKEPTTNENIRTIAFDQKRKDRQFELIAKAAFLSKRDFLTNLWLADHYNKEYDAALSLKYFDQILRSNEASREFVIERLVKELADHDLTVSLIPIFQNDPNWIVDFWRGVNKFGPALKNASVLRQNLYKAGFRKVSETDLQLLDRLVANEHFEEAYTLAEILSGGEMSKDGEVNHQFSSVSGIRPLDWEFNAEGNLSSGIDKSRDRLVVNVYPGSRGIAARQLLRLPKGEYRLNALYDEVQKSSNTPFSLSIECASTRKGSQKILNIDLTNKALAQDFKTTGENCIFYWLNININPFEVVTQSEISFSKIAIEQ